MQLSQVLDFYKEQVKFLGYYFAEIKFEAFEMVVFPLGIF